jgi:hypothetical protein
MLAGTARDVERRAAATVPIVRRPRAEGAGLDRIVAAFATSSTSAATGRARQVIAGTLAPGADAAEQAAWTLVANALLNLGETVSRSSDAGSGSAGR